MMRRQIAIFIAVIGFLLAAASGAPQADAKDSHLVYVGTYTGPTSKGIYAYRFNAVTGKSTSLGLVAETTTPSFLAIDRTRRFLYAVNEISDYQGQKSGGVSAFAIDPKTGKLAFLNEVPSRGADPCYVTLDKSGKYVLVANYGGGNVAAFPILNDGRLSEAAAFIQHTGRGHDPERQEGLTHTRLNSPTTIASLSPRTWGSTNCSYITSSRHMARSRRIIRRLPNSNRAPARAISLFIPPGNMYM